ncbi:MAG TPA: trypsin-like peptidase domain-containing protein [Baekduia sp.]|nr:trypsin-like peptidase domain-containing protein [Baekduia sp.]
MSPTPVSTKQLVAPMLVAAVLGGGVAAGVTVALDGGGSDTHTTTVIRQAAVGASAHENVSDGLTAADIYQRYAPGVVHVKAEIVQQTDNPFDPFGGAQRAEATGSGFVIDQDGNILTNNHVIDGARNVTVQFADKKTVKATVVGKDPSTDLALLRVDPNAVALHPLPLGSSKDVHVGDPTLAIGNPFGLDRTLTTGVVSALQRQITAPNGFAIKDVIQTDAAINPGNSGGPLIDAAGRVIGINSQIETGGSGEGNIGIGFAVPIDTAKQILAKLKAGESVQRGYLGVEALTIDRALDAADLPVQRGVLLQTVQAGSPADKAGLRGGNLLAQLPDGSTVRLGGDIITGVDGKPVRAASDLTDAISSRKPGDKVKLDVVRRDGDQTVEVTIANRPASQQVG